jgi:transmembrane sensor
MINYSNYSVEDYLSDASFRQWVLDGGFRNEDAAWSQWLSQNPSHTPDALKAREIILAVNISEKPFDEDYFETIRRETLQAVSDKRRSFIKPLWRAAAAVVLLSGFLGWYLQNNGTSPLQSLQAPVTAPAENIAFTRTNDSETIMPVALPDGSSVLLHPHSDLKYEKSPAGRRIVHLTGKAFFEVTKDPDCPFMVYSGEMVTRVLGTSFTITAYSSDLNFSVVVKTGKVTVSAVPDENESQAETMAVSTVNLVPNEQLVFDRQKMNFKRKDLQRVEMLKYVPATEHSYTFQDFPVTEIFNQIATAYGLKIDMDAAALEGCELTTNLTDEPLFEKLAIVCTSIGPGTSYVVEEGHIRVISKGCNQ